MTDKKVTQLSVLSLPSGVDLLLIVDDPSGTPVSKKISLNTFFGNIPSNTSITATLAVSGNVSFTGSNTNVTGDLNVSGTTILGRSYVSSNGIHVTTSLTPANSTITVEKGKIFWDTNYLYIAVANNTVKRVALTSF